MKEGLDNRIRSRRGNKRIALLLVLKALEQMSDKEHPIKQISLAKMVNDIGGALNLNVWCDRKTIGRHLKLLAATGYKIAYLKGKGYYIESNKFTKLESALVAKAIRESSLSDEQKGHLLLKLLAQEANLDKKAFIEYMEE